MKININDVVRVRLTDLGRKTLTILRAQENEHLATAGSRVRIPLAVVEVDGWSEWQLWELMAAFGEFCGNGLPLMFETEIELPDPKVPA